MQGGQGQNRTADTRIFSPLLYRLSYLASEGSASSAPYIAVHIAVHIAV